MSDFNANKQDIGKDEPMSLYNQAKQHFIASHQHPVNQGLHHIVNILAIVGIIYILFVIRVRVVCLILTQVLPIGGHWLFEKNKPAFTKYPGIVILVSLMWSFDRWFGFRDLMQRYVTNKK